MYQTVSAPDSVCIDGDFAYAEGLGMNAKVKHLISKATLLPRKITLKN